jgi:hypothetical protein
VVTETDYVPYWIRRSIRRNEEKQRSTFTSWTQLLTQQLYLRGAPAHKKSQLTQRPYRIYNGVEWRRRTTTDYTHYSRRQIDQWWWCPSCDAWKRKPQYLQTAGALDTVSNWMYSTGCPSAPPPPSHTATWPLTIMTGTLLINCSALLRCKPCSYFKLNSK